MYLVVDVPCKIHAASHTDMDVAEIRCLTVEDTQLMPVAQTACKPGLTLILQPM